MNNLKFAIRIFPCDKKPIKFLWWSYYPKELRTFRKDFQQLVKSIYDGRPTLGSLQIMFYCSFRRPKDATSAYANKEGYGDLVQYYINARDAIKGIVFEHERQIASVTMDKRFGGDDEDPEVRMSVLPLD